MVNDQGMIPGRPPLPPYGGLCMTCAHAVAVPSSRGSVFLQCRRELSDPAFRRYPLQPVLRCPGYEAMAVPPAGQD